MGSVFQAVPKHSGQGEAGISFTSYDPFYRETLATQLG